MVWPVEKQRVYLAALSDREVVHVAVTKSGEIVGFQTLGLWEPTIASMTHVADREPSLRVAEKLAAWDSR